MSTRFIPAKLTLRQQKLTWMNMLAHIHDERCNCSSPMEHTMLLIAEEEKELKFRPPEIDLLKQCLTGERTTAAGGDLQDDVIGEGDLDALFKEDFGEENTG